MTDDLRESIGKAAHEAAKRVLVEQGYAPHPTHVYTTRYCSHPEFPHSSDMADWDQLPGERRAYFVAVGMAGYEVCDHELDSMGAFVSHETLATWRQVLAERDALAAEVAALREAARVFLEIEREYTRFSGGLLGLGRRVALGDERNASLAALARLVGEGE